MQKTAFWTFMTLLKIRDDENRSQQEASFNHNCSLFLFAVKQHKCPLKLEKEGPRLGLFAKIRKTDIFFSFTTRAHALLAN